jgi:hypothetical protein
VKITPVRVCAGARNQRGFALIAVLSLAVLISAYLITTLLNPTRSELIREREQRSMDALRQAKTALIAYAASEQWQKSLGQTSDQPGGLPCPDIDDSGNSAGALCTGSSSRIGRLPWKSIGAADLRDASGERLWYAVSSNFYKNAANVVNSDTPGLLAITGSAPATDVVAVVIAPGDALSGQDRIANHNNYAAYLEGVSLVGADYMFNSISLSTGTANDRLLPITRADLMAVVEPVVADRIERDVKPLIQTYFSQWGAYPFPADFAPNGPGTNTSGGVSTRPQSNYVGDTSLRDGLLPLSQTLSYDWTTGNVILTGGKAQGVSNVSCNIVPGAGQCSFRIDPLDLGSNPAGWGPCTDAFGTSWRYCLVNPRFEVQGGVGANAGVSFANIPAASAVTVTDSGGTPLSGVTQTIHGTLTSAGVGTVLFDATWTFSTYNSSSFSSPTVVVTIPDVQVSPLTSPTNAATLWFIKNEWFRETYFALAPGYQPGGSGTCSAPNCVSVSGLPPLTYPPPNNNKRAILVLAGTQINGASSRQSAPPPANLSDYFEGVNANPPTNLNYVHRAGSIGLLTPGGAAINDRVVVLAP